MFKKTVKADDVLEGVTYLLEQKRKRESNASANEPVTWLGREKNVAILVFAVILGKRKKIKSGLGGRGIKLGGGLI